MDFPVPPQAKEMLRQMMEDPVSFGKGKGFEVPGELSGDPQAMVMYLIRTGQVGGNAMQRIMPMIRQMNGR